MRRSNDMRDPPVRSGVPRSYWITRLRTTGPATRPAAGGPGYRAGVDTGRSPDGRPQEAMRLMAGTAGIVAVLAGTVGAARGEEQLIAVAVAFSALALYLYARWRDAVGTGSPALLAAGVVGCAAACVGLALTGYWWFAVCLVVPTVFGLLRWAGRGAARTR